MRSLFVILGNQLFDTKYIRDFKNSTFFMCEDYELCTYQRHHKLKILLFLSSMRSYADLLKNEKYKIKYFDLDNDFKVPYERKLKNFIIKNNITELITFEIEDKFFENKIRKLVNTIKIKWKIIDSPMFLNSRKEFRNYLNLTKKPLMANFYKIVRKKYNILMDGDKPRGGKWSYDSENRKKLPKNFQIPIIPQIQETNHTKKLKDIVTKKFSKHPGDIKNFWMPTTQKDAEKWLNFFIKNKLNLFGDYEDAVDKDNNILFHSALSPLINLGLLTPLQIIKEIKKVEKKIKINSFEGYFRQIAGWREFIRGIYQNYDKNLEKNNFFNHNNFFKNSWYEGTTGLVPLDHSIKNSINYGWTHHIERLMILANLMNLCEIKPKEVYNWFMEMNMDSSDWVMMPNVYGMGLFSDGGIFSSKPYICGSSYIMKMMNFKKGEWNDVMDGLYWRFINKNRNFFLKNPRLSMMVKIFDKMKIERKNHILNEAEKFINKNTYVK